MKNGGDESCCEEANVESTESVRAGVARPPEKWWKTLENNGKVGNRRGARVRTGYVEAKYARKGEGRRQINRTLNIPELGL